MTTTPGIPASPDEPVGQVLARMRKAKRLTGGQLAAIVGMSQPKISRIERGQGLPDPEDIGSIARALGADEPLARELMDRAESSHDRMTDWRPTPIGLAGRQKSVAQWEAASKVVRVFEPALVVGLLQTSGYARSVLVAFQRLAGSGAAPMSETAVLAAVSARVQRQEILADAGKTFRFVMTETVLRNHLCPPAEMLAQIAHLRAVSARYSNVSIEIIPDLRPWVVAPQHGFTMFDDRAVIVDLYNTGLTSRGRTDAHIYRQVFDLFEEMAVADIDPLLDKYEKLYVDELLHRPG
jgi:transcriptional regulator with XRE-family HTH domain